MAGDVLGPARRAVSCPLCNEKFFPASLPFHQKQCAKKRAQRVVPCPYCGTQVTQLDLAEHVKVCPKGAGRAGGGKGSGRAASSSADAGPTHYEPQVLDDGRMGCVYCGRFFAPDRIDKHQEICGKLKSARPKGADGVATQGSKKVFNSQAARTGSGASFVSTQHYERKQEESRQALVEKRERSTEPGWRRAHREFQAVCQAARGGSAGGEPSSSSSSRPPDPNSVVCPYCSRRFDKHAAERHIAICANVISRPKKPPTSSSASTPSSPSMTVRTLRPSECPEVRTIRPDGPPDGWAPRGSASSPGRRQASPGGAVRKARSPARLHAGSGSSDSVDRNHLAIPRDDDEAEGSGSPSGAAASGGGGLHAARNLRRQASNGQLQQSPEEEAVQHSGSPLPKRRSASSPRVPGARNRPPPVPRRGGPGVPHHQPAAFRGGGADDYDATRLKLDSGSLADSVDTALPDEVSVGSGSSSQAPAGGTSGVSSVVARVGLRRSAMMYRLLSQVPSDALVRELAECGVHSAEAMDQEGLIEAVLEQLI